MKKFTYVLLIVFCLLLISCKENEFNREIENNSESSNNIQNNSIKGNESATFYLNKYISKMGISAYKKINLDINLNLSDEEIQCIKEKIFSNNYESNYDIEAQILNISYVSEDIVIYLVYGAAEYAIYDPNKTEHHLQIEDYDFIYPLHTTAIVCFNGDNYGLYTAYKLGILTRIKLEKIYLNNNGINIEDKDELNKIVLEDNNQIDEETFDIVEQDFLKILNENKSEEHESLTKSNITSAYKLDDGSVIFLIQLVAIYEIYESEIKENSILINDYVLTYPLKRHPLLWKNGEIYDMRDLSNYNLLKEINIYSSDLPVSHYAEEEIKRIELKDEYINDSEDGKKIKEDYIEFCKNQGILSNQSLESIILSIYDFIDSKLILIGDNDYLKYESFNPKVTRLGNFVILYPYRTNLKVLKDNVFYNITEAFKKEIISDIHLSLLYYQRSHEVINEEKHELDFSDNEVIITISHDVSLTEKVYLVSDFSEIDCIEVKSLSYNMKDLLLNGKLNNEQKNNYHDIYVIVLEEKSKEHVLEVIDILNQREDIFAAEVNAYFDYH